MKKIFICLLAFICFSAAAVEEPNTQSGPARNVSVFEALQALCYSETDLDPENANVALAQAIYDRMKPSEKRACMERTDDYLSYLIEKYTSG